eukprot:scaffold1375_cov96-Isochrysis_galbana.AAC.8
MCTISALCASASRRRRCRRSRTKLWMYRTMRSAFGQLLRLPQRNQLVRVLPADPAAGDGLHAHHGALRYFRSQGAQQRGKGPRRAVQQLFKGLPHQPRTTGGRPLSGIDGREWEGGPSRAATPSVPTPAARPSAAAAPPAAATAPAGLLSPAPAATARPPPARADHGPTSKGPHIPRGSWLVGRGPASVPHRRTRWPERWGGRGVSGVGTERRLGAWWPEGAASGWEQAHRGG